MIRVSLSAIEPTKTIREQYAMATPMEIGSWAKAWGCKVEDIRRRASSLGVRRSPEAARAAYIEAGFASAANAFAYEPPMQESRDEHYTRLCRKAGGFPVSVNIDGRTVWMTRRFA